VTHERERQENVFQELQHAIDYLDHAPAGFLSIDPEGTIVYLNATLATWLDYDLAQVGSGGLTLSDVVPRNVVAMMTSISGASGDVRTETFDLDLRRRNGQFLPVRLYHRVAFGSDGKPGPSRTLVLNRSPGLDVDEGQRAAEVRFARFFNNTPIAIATVNRSGRLMRTNASFARLFGTLPRAAEGEPGPSILDGVLPTHRASFEETLRAAAEARSDIPPLELQVAGEGGRSVRMWVTPVSDADGEGESAILYALDTTELRQVEERLAQAQKMNAVGPARGRRGPTTSQRAPGDHRLQRPALANHRPTDPSFRTSCRSSRTPTGPRAWVRPAARLSRRQTLRPEVLNLTTRSTTSPCC
jgi:two-component system cell cycle sensor histidine kinase/response regulator CckA